MHFAEFGVVMMLFLVGLELQPALLWKLRTQLLGLGWSPSFGYGGSDCVDRCRLRLGFV